MDKRPKSRKYVNFNERVLSIRIVGIVKRLLMPANYLFEKLHLDLSNWVALLIFEVLIACLVFATWGLLKIPVNLGGRLWVLWGNILTAACIALVDKNLNDFLIMLDLYRKELNKQSYFAQWIEKAFDLRRQITISFLFAFLIFPFTMLFFNQTIGLHANSSGAIILFVNVWIIGNGFYWIVVLPTSAKALFHSFKCSGYFDPRNTVWINAFSDVYENAAASVSVIGVLALFSLVPSQLPMIRYISFGWLILILILVSVPFLYARSYLSKLIQYIRYSTMTDIQERIVAILQQKPSFYIVKKQKIELTEGSTDNEIDADELNQLLSIYDLTKHSESSLLKLSSSSQFINSLLLPILSFVIINYVKIVKFISDILNIIF